MHFWRIGPTLICGLLIAASTPAADERSQSGSAPVAGTGLVAGQVIDATSRRPVGAAVVTLTLDAPAPGPGAPTSPAQTRRAVAVANTEGRFVFRDLPAGSYTLSSTLDGFVAGAFGRRRPGGPTRSIVLTDGARVTDAVIPMWRLGAITGTIRDDRGESVVGVAVWAMRRTLTNGRVEFSFNGGTVETTDDRGRFRLSRLTPGVYALTVPTVILSHPVALVDAVQVAVTSGGLPAIAREWLESGAIQISGPGLVVDDWQVSVSSGTLPALPGPNGTLLVHPELFYSNASSLGEATLVTLAAGETRAGIDMTLPLVQGVRVSGVLTGLDGPATNQGVRLSRVTPDDVTYDIPVRYSTSDRSGRFAFHGVTPGDYFVQAYRIPYTGPSRGAAPPASTGTTIQPVFAETRVTVGRTALDGLSLLLQPGARLSGRVVFDGTTQPLAARIQQMSVALRPLAGSVRVSDARVDADARFTTAGYPPGRYAFTVVVQPGPEWALASVRIGDEDAAAQAFTLGTADISDVVVTFSDRVISLSGTVKAADPATDPESTIIAYPVDFDAWLASGMSSRRFAMTAVSQTGVYDLRIPMPGEYMVVAVPADVAPAVDREFVKRFGPNAVHMSFAAGDKKTQVLTLRPGR